MPLTELLSPLTEVLTPLRELLMPLTEVDTHSELLMPLSGGRDAAHGSC